MSSIAGIFEKESHKTILDLKCMEKFPILMIIEIHIELLIPYNTSSANDIHELEEKRVANQIVNQGNCSH